MGHRGSDPQLSFAFVHPLTICVRQNQRRYHNRNWSENFQCPSCGRFCRQNLNWLGNHKGVYCDGQKFQKLPHGPGDYQRERGLLPKNLQAAPVARHT